MSVTLICPVRDCSAPLTPDERSWRCSNKHVFDLARSGYLNLLQPQDRKSKQPGDSPAAVKARAAFLEEFGDPFAGAYASLASTTRGGAILDVGCGVGYHLEHLRASLGASEAHGVDLSSSALDLAARRYRECMFVVANADRSLPYADDSFDAIFSITARRNPAEFERLLRARGSVVIAVPGADDLIEARELVQGEGKLVDRRDVVMSEFADRFELVQHIPLRAVVVLPAEAIRALLAATYRGARKSQSDRLSSVDEMAVTFSRDLFVFTPN